MRNAPCHCLPRLLGVPALLAGILPSSPAAAVDAKPTQVHAAQARSSASPTAPLCGTQSNPFAASVKEVLGILEQRRLLPSMSPAKRRKVLNTLLKSLDCDAELAPRVPGTPQKTGDRRENGVLRMQVVGGVFDYLLFSAVDAAALHDVTAVCRTAKEGHYEGLILDFRYAGGDSPAVARSLADALTKTALPIAVLVNHGTHGAAEIAAALLRGQSRVMLLGQPTRGRPFGRVPQKLTSGDILLVPAPKTATDGGLPSARPIQPDIVTTQDIDAQSLHDPDRDLDPNADPVLRRAVDLLNAVRVFSEKPTAFSGPAETAATPEKKSAPGPRPSKAR